MGRGTHSIQTVLGAAQRVPSWSVCENHCACAPFRNLQLSEPVPLDQLLCTGLQRKLRHRMENRGFLVALPAPGAGTTDAAFPGLCI